MPRFIMRTMQIAGCPVHQITTSMEWWGTKNGAPSLCAYYYNTQGAPLSYPLCHILPSLAGGVGCDSGRRAVGNAALLPIFP